mgnify:CR=1 FL=1
MASCWAEGMSRRQRQDFHNPHLIPELLLAPLSIKKPSIILVNFMGDLGGDWVNPEAPVYQLDGNELSVFSLTDRHGNKLFKLRDIIFRVIAARPEHTFIFLTKNPKGFIPWGNFPDNAWVGATVCNERMFKDACSIFIRVKAKHKWLSIEPLLESISNGVTVEPDPTQRRPDNKDNVKDILYFLKDTGIDFVVIGGQTRPTVMPKIEWVKEIVQAADKAGIKVWLKDNLWEMLTENDFTPAGSKDHDLYFAEMTQLRQERPIPRLTAADVQEVKA